MENSLLDPQWFVITRFRCRNVALNCIDTAKRIPDRDRKCIYLPFFRFGFHLDSFLCRSHHHHLFGWRRKCRPHNHISFPRRRSKLQPEICGTNPCRRRRRSNTRNPFRHRCGFTGPEWAWTRWWRREGKERRNSRKLFCAGGRSAMQVLWTRRHRVPPRNCGAWRVKKLIDNISNLCNRAK